MMSQAHTTPSTSTGTTQTLYVAWQDRKSRTYWPVARLRVFDPTDTDKPYEFVYLRGAQADEVADAGFEGFVGFPDFDRVYKDESLFPLFKNRLMSRSRPDFAEYAARLDLKPDEASDISILARSGGRRATDSIEIFPCPDLERDGCYITYFLAHGVRYLNGDVQELLNSRDVVNPGDRLFLQWDMQNDADRAAISMRTQDHVAVGFMPRYLLGDAWQLVHTQDSCGWPIEVVVKQINMPPAPVQQRLLCRMKACWPNDFSPYQSEHYQPIPMSVGL